MHESTTMGQVNVSLPSDGSTADVSDYNTPITSIVDEINGNLDNSNIDAAAAIAGSKLASGGVGTTQLADSAVTPAKILAGAGTDWAWDSWTPTLSGRFTDGDWTKTCSYIQVGKTVIAKISLIASDATPMGGGSGEAVFTLPVTSVAVENAGHQIGTVRLRDANGSIYSAIVYHTSTTTASIKNIAVSGANTIEASLSSTAPFTWTTSDGVLGTLIYEAA